MTRVMAAICVSATVAAGVGFGLERVVSSQAAESLVVVGHRGGPVRAVAISGSRAFMAQGIGITSVDVAAPEAPTELFHTLVGAGADVHAIALHGNPEAGPDGLLLVVGTDSGVHTFVVSDPEARPDLWASMVTPGVVTGVAVHAGRALFTDLTAGLLYGDVSNDPPGIHARLAESAGMVAPPAFNRAGSVGLAAYDRLFFIDVMAVPPVRMADLALPAPAVGLAVVGELAVVSTTAGLVVVDIRDPVRPTTLAQLPGVPPGRLESLGPHDLLVLGPEIRRIDLSAPEAPVDVYGGPGPYGTLAGIQGAARGGGLLAAARGTEMTLMVVADPERPALAGSVESVWPIVDADAVGGLVYVSRGPLGLDVVDPNVASGPGALLSYKPPGGVFGMASANGRALLSTGQGAHVLGVGNPAAPVLIGSLGADWPQSAWVAADGAHGVMADPTVVVMATLAETPPRELGRLNLAEQPGRPNHAVLQGLAMLPGVAYLADGPAGLGVIDLSDPVRMRLVGQVDLGSSVSAVASDQERLVVASGPELVLLDATTPMAPVEAARIDVGFAPVHIAPAGQGWLVAGGPAGLAYVAEESGSLRVAARTRASFPYQRAVNVPQSLAAVGAGLLRLTTSGEPPKEPGPTLTIVPELPTAGPQPSPATATATPEPTSTPGPGGRIALPWSNKAP